MGKCIGLLKLTMRHMERAKALINAIPSNYKHTYNDKEAEI
jgi:hypothetical protein